MRRDGEPSRLRERESVGGGGQRGSETFTHPRCPRWEGPTQPGAGIRPLATGSEHGGRRVPEENARVQSFGRAFNSRHGSAASTPAPDAHHGMPVRPSIPGPRSGPPPRTSARSILCPLPPRPGERGDGWRQPPTATLPHPWHRVPDVLERLSAVARFLPLVDLGETTRSRRPVHRRPVWTCLSPANPRSAFLVLRAPQD